MRATDGKREEKNGVYCQELLSQFSIFENGPDYLHNSRCDGEDGWHLLKA
jgi:hypothetical protein